MIKTVVCVTVITKYLRFQCIDYYPIVIQISLSLIKSSVEKFCHCQFVKPKTILKIFGKSIQKTCYKTLGTSIINVSLSPYDFIVISKYQEDFLSVPSLIELLISPERFLTILGESTNILPREINSIKLFYFYL